MEWGARKKEVRGAQVGTESVCDRGPDDPGGPLVPQPHQILKEEGFGRLRSRKRDNARPLRNADAAAVPVEKGQTVDEKKQNGRPTGLTRMPTKTGIHRRKRPKENKAEKG